MRARVWLSAIAVLVSRRAVGLERHPGLEVLELGQEHLASCVDDVVVAEGEDSGGEQDDRDEHGAEECHNCGGRLSRWWVVVPAETVMTLADGRYLIADDLDPVGGGRYAGEGIDARGKVMTILGSPLRMGDRRTATPWRAPPDWSRTVPVTVPVVGPG